MVGPVGSKTRVALFSRFSGDKFRLVLATTLREDGQPDAGDWNPVEMESNSSRADSFEYVMYGKIYRIEGDDKVKESHKNKLWVHTNTYNGAYVIKWCNKMMT